MRDSRDEARLLGYVGLPESGVLEFKSGNVLRDAKSKQSSLVQELTKEVSAFANGSGGLLVIGMSETKQGKSRIASGIDGFDHSEVPKEWLQNLVEGNLRPYLPGIRFHFVPVPAQGGGLVVAVIEVPAGNTAYQASDCIYYGRSEFEAKALPDHEVRLRMNRGSIPQVAVELCDINLVPPEERQMSVKVDGWKEEKRIAERRGPLELENLLKGIEASYGSEAVADFCRVTTDGLTAGEIGQQFTFGVQVRNTGEVTVRDLIVVYRFRYDDTSPVLEKSEKYDEGRGKHLITYSAIDRSQAFRWDLQQMHGHTPTLRILPGDSVAVLAKPLHLSISNNPNAWMDWTLFVDGVRPQSGSIEICSALNLSTV